MYSRPTTHLIGHVKFYLYNQGLVLHIYIGPIINLFKLVLSPTNNLKVWNYLINNVMCLFPKSLIILMTPKSKVMISIIIKLSCRRPPWSFNYKALSLKTSTNTT